MSAPAIARSPAALQHRVAAWRMAGDRVALVPTMGALHAGHLALVRAARADGSRCVVSLFVNPTQFAPSEDFATYPRTFAQDLAVLEREGADLVYAPDEATMYPAAFATTVTVGGPALAGLEDAVRPTFFAGVATVVAKLLIACGPDVAVFGEKDYQQLLVVRRLAVDLDMPVAILGVPTVREPDGLALSSRNIHLGAPQRRSAAVLPRVLGEAAAALQRGEPAPAVLAAGEEQLAAAGFAVDYLALRDAATLARIEGPGAGPMRLLAAARLGAVRLIDNVPV